jgi:transcriptional regulator with XRE-family HTH domain
MADQALNLIGDRLRAQRHKLHMSLDVLASRTNLSKSFLSQVERGIASPSIESLHQIAEAIGVPMFLFFVEEDGQKVVRPRTERRVLVVPDSRFEYESIWFGANRKMEIILGRLKPGTTSSDRPRSHLVADLTSVEECFFVLQGRVEFQLGEECYVLEPGDSAYFNGSLPHRYSACGEEDTVLLFSITPPAIAR